MAASKTFHLNIHTGNAAFEDDPFLELARILRKIANNLETSDRQWVSRDGSLMSQTIRDFNGNDVGRYALKGNS